MRKGVLFRALMAIAMGFMSIVSVAAQENTSVSAGGNASTLKPCVVVDGAVRAPGRVEIRRLVRLHELLASAGGVTERAEGKIQIIHSGSKCFAEITENRSRKPSASESEKVTVVKLADVRRGDENADIYISAGDVVIVKESEPVFIAGNVANPQALYPKEPLKLSRAIALAGGATRSARAIEIIVYRAVANTYTKHIRLDLRELRKRDLVLQPHDIVDVGPAGLLIPQTSPMFDTRPLIPRSYRIIY